MVAVIFFIITLGSLLLGLLAKRYSSFDKEEYFMARWGVPSWMVAFSAVATNHSGFVFIGQIGFIYIYGLNAFWLTLAWKLGDLMSLTFHKPLRLRVAETETYTLAELILGKQVDPTFAIRCLKLVAGVILSLCLIMYAAAQISAASETVVSLELGGRAMSLVCCSAFVILYASLGGIRASIWTDIYQTIVIFASLCALSIAAIYYIHSHAELVVSDMFSSNIIPVGGVYGQSSFHGTFFALLLLGWFFGGLGSIGQPQLLLKFMTTTTNDSPSKARIQYYLISWGFTFFVYAIGLSARLILPDLGDGAAESAMPSLAVFLLPDWLQAIVLCGAFSAAISTADSLLLSCSSEIVRGFNIKWFDRAVRIPIATVIPGVLTFLLALFGVQSVFNSILSTWAVMASCFAPALIFVALGIELNPRSVLLSIATGLLACLLWRVSDANRFLYEGAPGIIVGLGTLAACYLTSRPLTAKND